MWPDWRWSYSRLIHRSPTTTTDAAGDFHEMSVSVYEQMTTPTLQHLQMASPKCSSPSSSAVTIPRPGKSILKKPPPPQQSFFSLSRLSRLLPNQNQSSSSASSTTNAIRPDENLKRAHFFLPHLATVYPISAANPPTSAFIKEEKKTVEAREAERRRRIVRGNSYGPGNPDTDEWWSMDKVESFYQECCVGREEEPHSGISAALKVSTVDSYGSPPLSPTQRIINPNDFVNTVESLWESRQNARSLWDIDNSNTGRRFV